MSTDYDGMTDEELWDSPLGHRLRNYADKLLLAEAERIRITARRKTDGVVAEGLEFGRAVVSPLGDPNSMLSNPDAPTRADTDPWAQWDSPERTGLTEALKATDGTREAAKEAAKAYIASFQGDERPAAEEFPAEKYDMPVGPPEDSDGETPVTKAPPTTPLAVSMALGMLVGNHGFAVSEGDGFHRDPYVMMSFDAMVKVLGEIPGDRW